MVNSLSLINQETLYWESFGPLGFGSEERKSKLVDWQYL